jgi:hypothetical protein
MKQLIPIDLPDRRGEYRNGNSREGGYGAKDSIVVSVNETPNLTDVNERDRPKPMRKRVLFS